MIKIKKQTTLIVIILLLISAIVVTPIVQGADLHNEQSEHEKEIARLFEVLYISIDEAKTKQAELNEAIADLTSIGDEAIEPIVKELRCPLRRRKTSPTFDMRAIRLLGSIGTDKARQTLLDIALDKSRTKLSKQAARQYVSIIQDKSDAKKLLASDKSEVLLVVLPALSGVSVDPNLLSRLEEFLQSTRWYFRLPAAKVIGADPGTTYAREKVSVIVESIKTVEQLPKANEKFQYDRFGTLADNVYYRLINVLTKIKGAEAYLDRPTDKLQGRLGMCVVIARACKGDVSVKGQLRNIIKDPTMVAMPMMRFSALNALGRIGTTDDLPFLQEIAKTDPLEVADFGGRLYELVNGKVVITGNNMSPMPKPTDPWYNKPRRYYPIQHDAREVIKLIEKRNK